jgi:hypothetical protein
MVMLYKRYMEIMLWLEVMLSAVWVHLAQIDIPTHYLDYRVSLFLD